MPRICCRALFGWSLDQGRAPHASEAVLSAVALLSLGCATPWFAQADKAEIKESKRQAIKAVLESPERPRLVREIAVPSNLTLSRLESVALVNNLPKTGGIAHPSVQREKLLDTMRRHEVENANQLLDDPNTAMVVTQVIVPPAAQKLDHLDVLVKLSSHAEGKDLQGGWLMRTMLAEGSVQGGKLRAGFDHAVAEGTVVTDAQITGSEDPAAALSGRVVGGAVLLKQRKVGLGIQSEFAHAITMATLAPAINKRFTYFDGREQVGIATPKQESYIELEIPKRYQHDPFHFLNVVLSIGFTDTASQSIERIELCRQQLNEPTTARDATWQLEAIGKEAIPVLVEGCGHPNREARFYAAHSLAYLNDARAIEPLAELARTEPAFRAMSLNALTVLEQYEARDALAGLLHAEDIEARYGAVLALRKRDSGDSEVAPLAIGDTGFILEIPSNTPPAVAVSLSRTPEVVIFGENPAVHLPAFLRVNPRLLLRALPRGRVSASMFAPGQEDKIQEATSDLRSLLVAISQVGGDYGDWVSFVGKCQRDGLIQASVGMNPIPDAGRIYHRDSGMVIERQEAAVESTLENASGISSPSNEPFSQQRQSESWLSRLSPWK